MNIEPDIFDYLETTSLEPHDDYTSEISYKEQKIIWNRLKKQDQEIARLNNIINKAIHYINLNQDEKTLCLNYNQLKALRGILKQDDFYLKIFEEQLKELKEGNK